MIAWMLAGLLAVLVLLAGCGAMGRTRVARGGGVAVSAGFVVLAVAALLQGGATPVLLPFGPPWAPLSLGLDGLSAWFLLLLGLGGVAAGLAGWAAADAAPRRLMLWPLLLGGLALTLLAADAFALLLGFALAAFTAHALLLAEGAWGERPAIQSVGPAESLGERPIDPRGERRGGAWGDLLATLLAVAGLAMAVGLLAGLSGDLSFAGLRATPPGGATALAVLLLVLPGIGARAVLPLLAPLPPGPAMLLVAGAMPPVALYVLARLLLDFGGPAQPLWWGAPLLVVGAAAALAGALRALRQEELGRLLAGVALHHLGLAVVALGLVAALRAADLGALAAVAGGAALLHLLAQALFMPLLWLAAAEVSQGAGFRHLDRLGGLVHAMPMVAWAALLGAAAAAMLPPLPGFAGGWLLLQSLFAAWRVGVPGFQILVVLVVAVLGLSIATLASALLRFWGLAFLGRPRTPRTLGAREAASLPRGLLLALAALTLLLGLLPGPLLRLAEPALLLLTGHGGAPDLGLLTISAGQTASDYTPLAVGAVLAVLLVVVGVAMRRASPRPVLVVPPWDDGFTAPPPHLPFGDPATQPSAAGLAAALRPPLPYATRPRLPAAGIHPAGIHPAGIHPAGIHPAGIHPAGPPLWREIRGWAARWPALPPRWRLPAIGGGKGRRALRLCLGTLVVLLALVAWLGAGG